MIKVIDFCEVWFQPESVVRVAAIVGDHHCHTPRHGFKETMDAFLGFSRSSSFHALQTLICRPGKQFNLVIDEEPLDNACHVRSRIILLKYGCGQALKDQCGGAKRCCSASSLHGVSRLESDHRGVADRCVTRQ
ncbi:uncharacterized protein TNCV_3913681 [Trichonephila clavipes]|nr:uncharacterized protein TNCV_3913681 [Trichonephila clavipes]